MNIIGVINHNNEGGARQALLNLAGYARAGGHSFSIIYLYGTHRKHSNHENILCPTPKLTIFDVPLLSYRLVTELHKEAPTAVVCFLPLAGVLGSICAAISGIKTRIVSQRNPSNTYSTSIRWLDNIVGSTAFYTHNICNSFAVQQSFSKFSYPICYQRKLSVVYNAVELDTNTVNLNLRAKLGIAVNERLLVSVGRLAKQKRHDLAIEITAKMPNIHLAIAGHGELEAELKQLTIKLGCVERVHFLGKLKHSDIFPVLSAADVFLQASSYEGQSNSLLEALVTGNVIVCSNIESHREVLISKVGTAGYLVESREAEDWIIVLEKVLNSPSVQKGLTKVALQRALDFSPSNMLSGFLSRVNHNG